MDALPLQILILQWVRLPNVLQALNHNVLAHAELPVPACAHLRGDVLQALLLRLYPICRPLIGVVIAAGLILLKYVRPLPIQRLSQVLQQHLQRLIRRLLQQGDAQALIDDGLQILNALYTAVPPQGLRSGSALPSPLQKPP